MAEQQTPPKPKVGSLRDRIAAFEKGPSGGSNLPTTAPALRPKPAGGVSWKPKPPSPPSSPPSGEASSNNKISGSMNASDAKESITKVASLKERMAALQGKGGFGGSPPPVVPKPAVEKPKWKPPPQVSVAPAHGDEEKGVEESANTPPAAPKAPVAVIAARSEDEADGGKDKVEEKVESTPGEGGDSTAEADPEEEERQRRAAIAARMAKLGGARVGMAPMFGGPPVAKKPEPVAKSLEVEAPAEEANKAAIEATPSPPVAAKSHSEDQLADVPPEITDEPKDSSSPPPVEAESQAQGKAPTSMPLPSAPRRAGPPRKKVPKTPEIPPPNVNEALLASPDDLPAPTPPLDVEETVTLVSEGEVKPVDDDKPPTPEKASSPAPELPPVESEPVVDVQPKEEFVAEEEEPTVAPSHPADRHEPKLEAQPSVDVQVHTEPLQEKSKQPVAEEPEVDEEAEEAARRQRVAEKLAKMGGINPFALPPQRKPSLPVDEGTAVSPPPRKRTSISQEDVAPPPPPPRRSSSEHSVQDVVRSPPAHTKPIPEVHEESEPVAAETVSKGVDDDNDAQDESRGLPAGQGTEVRPEDVEEEADAGGHHLDDRVSDNEAEAGAQPTERIEVDVEGGHVDSADIEEDNIQPVHLPSGAKSQYPEPTSPSPSVVVPDYLEELPTPPNRPESVPTGEDPAIPVDPVPIPPPAATVHAHAHAPARALPPPPPAALIPEPIEVEDDINGSKTTNTPGQHTQSTLSSIPVSDDEDDEKPRHIPPPHANEDEEPPLPVPNRRSVEASHPQPTRTFRRLPQTPPISAPGSDVESDYDDAPALPRKRPVTPGTPPTNEVPIIVPPRVVAEEVTKKLEPSPLRQSYHASSSSLSSLSGRGVEQTGQLSPPLESPDHEIIDEEEGDPIDPDFHHPPSRRVSTANLSASLAVANIDDTPYEEPRAASLEEDEQKGHRQTIAERMAKLGGIKLGAAPPIPGMRPVPPPKTRISGDDGSVPAETSEDEPAATTAEAPAELTEEEEERARKERIAAKLANMGGMRIGMLPLGGGALRPHTSHILTEQTPTPLTPPARPVPPPRSSPPPQHHDSETDIDSNMSASFTASEDGVEVEAEESEIEEVSHEDAQEEEEVPPPVPSRASRRRPTGDSEVSQTSTIPSARPPVPASPPARKASVQTMASTGRKSSVESNFGTVRRPPPVNMPQSDYVMVDEPASFSDDVPPPLPPGRHFAAKTPPARVVPPAPEDSISSQWELPSISAGSLDFSDGPDLSLSWTEAVVPPPEPLTPSRTTIPPPQPISVPVPIADRQLTPDELMAVWGRVGVQICEVATTLHDKSKKTLIGDGTYEGFVNLVLNEVPNAALPFAPEDPYGFLVYVQTGGSVHKRVSDIMPGDVVELQDAKLKGHKGLQAYSQNVEHLVGIVSEFEPKKSKVRVFQANQHVGQQTVEAASYRLDDLKSGTIKIYRVLEN